jgi:hypothetical protein
MASVVSGIITNTRALIAALTPTTRANLTSSYRIRTEMITDELVDQIATTDATHRHVWVQWGESMADMSPYTTNDARIRERELNVTILYCAPSGHHPHSAGLDTQTMAAEDADQIMCELHNTAKFPTGLHLMRFVSRRESSTDGKMLQTLVFRVVYVYTA